MSLAAFLLAQTSDRGDEHGWEIQRALHRVQEIREEKSWVVCESPQPLLGDPEKQLWGSSSLSQWLVAIVIRP